MPNDKNDKKNQKSTAVQKKGTEAVRSRDRDRRTGGKARTSGTPEPEQRRIDPVPESTRFINQILPFVFIVTAVLLAAFFLLSGIDGAVGTVGVKIRDFFCGLLGWPSFIMPLILVNLALFWRKYVDLGIVRPKLWMSLGCVTVISSLVHVFYIPSLSPTHYNWADYGASIFGKGEAVSNWTHGIQLKGGGFIGGLIGGLIRSAFGYAGAVIILLALLFVLALCLFGVTPGYLIDMIKYRVRKNREANADVREERRRASVAEKEERRRDRQSIKEERRRAAVIEAQMIREDREAELAARRAERARAASEVKKHHVPNFEELIPGTTDIPAPADSDAPSPEPVLITPMPDDPVPAARASATRAEPDIVPAPAENVQPEEVRKTEPEPVSDVKKIPPVREKRPIDDPYDLDSIFGKSDAPAAVPEPAADVAVTPAAVPETPVEDTGELEIKLTAISDTDHSDADITEENAPAAQKPAERQVTDYIFPPVDLLHPNTAPSDEDVETELRTNAQKLMETLASFNVKIKKIEYSRGPTITRYELYPEAGTRIRTISNLVDDIAMSLATTGVRIEAPIPNKSAVGVEVPNRTRSTVFIRELIESEIFRNSKSSLTACLGKDVAGNMIIFDIAKMPHLLIAGTTGSGKSVCINCIIISLLYKARPDEVQLIMIDPKKIEMSMYSDLPHLKVPVVTDTKRATGTLNAAVNEMEHRFEVFEEIGVRDIDGYNKVTAGDPEHPPMPKIVIVIDELADLMMTAPDQIETSICRLAQKARAAGIHLIIGTQRPSVDVITGLIKANVPSRIAFTVASQVDSRTIIDIAGAEKLIGKGDMLYAPIGSLKPRRAQGALVDDEEVAAVNAFIKNNYGCADYDGDFISDIDREAERAVAGKKGAASMGGGDLSGGAAAAGGDPQFRQALKLAVDSGTIATSYLQRTLSIGYGRAARLIDQMAKMGFVSGMNGTKPRTVLLTLPQYMELEANGDPRLDGVIPKEEE